MHIEDWVDVEGLSEGITAFTWVADEAPSEITDTGAFVFRWKTGRSKRREPVEYVWYARLRAAAQHWDTRLFDALYEAGSVENGVTSPAHRRIKTLANSLDDPSEDVVEGAYRMFVATINANQDIADVWGQDAYYAACIIAYEARRADSPVPTPDSFGTIERDAVIAAHEDLVDPVPPSLLDVIGSVRALPDGAPDTRATRVVTPPEES